tara:strand:- start:11604 stop:11900 length:297 start_codon:yes stop_codon:yes gene_type:complete
MSTQKTSFWLTPKGLAALGLIGAATYFLLIEHRQHVWQYLPFLILLACPFMHLFMHKGHGGHSNHREHGSSGEGEPDQDAYQRGLEEGRKQVDHRDHH